MGIIGNRFVSDFSFEVIIEGGCWMLDGGCWVRHARGSLAATPNPRTSNIQNPTSVLSYPAFSSSVRLIFCDNTISFVTWNSRTFL
jgi:hypothetical protein